MKAEEHGTEQNIKNMPEAVRLFTPNFTTPLDIRTQKTESKEGNRRPILPGIVYPFQLIETRFPCDLGTYLFWETYKSAELKLDCEELHIQSRQDLLELCTPLHAAEYIISQMKQIPEDEKLTKASSLNEDVQIGWNELDSVTIST